MKVLDEQIKQKQKEEEEQKRLEEEKKQEALKQASQSTKVVLGGQKIGARASSLSQVKQKKRSFIRSCARSFALVVGCWLLTLSYAVRCYPWRLMLSY